MPDIHSLITNAVQTIQKYPDAPQKAPYGSNLDDGRKEYLESFHYAGKDKKSSIAKILWGQVIAKGPSPLERLQQFDRIISSYPEGFAKDYLRKIYVNNKIEAKFLFGENNTFASENGTIDIHNEDFAQLAATHILFHTITGVIEWGTSFTLDIKQFDRDIVREAALQDPVKGREFMNALDAVTVNLAKLTIKELLKEGSVYRNNLNCIKDPDALKEIEATYIFGERTPKELSSVRDTYKSNNVDFKGNADRLGETIEAKLKTIFYYSSEMPLECKQYI